MMQEFLYRMCARPAKADGKVRYQRDADAREG